MEDRLILRDEPGELSVELVVRHVGAVSVVLKQLQNFYRKTVELTSQNCVQEEAKTQRRSNCKCTGTKKVFFG